MMDGGDGPGPGLTILLSVEDERWDALDLGMDIEAFVRRAALAALGGAGIDAGTPTELSVTLADDAAVRAVNAEWRGKDRPTNILSFPMLDLVPGEAPGPMLGDLVAAFETVAREAEAEGKRPADHLCHLLVHGTLHCLGFDHETDEEAEEMEALETAILAGLGIGDPYREPADGSLDPGAGRAPMRFETEDT